MDVWKCVPEWFTVDNYIDAERLTAEGWVNELMCRRFYFDVLMRPEGFENGGAIDRAKAFFAHIKLHGLANKFQVSASPAHELLEKSIKESIHKTSAVRELTALNAYSILYESENKGDIEQDLAVMGELVDFGYWHRLEERMAIFGKYNRPLSELEECGSDRLLEVNLDASDEQILAETQAWLSEARGESRFLKRQFSSTDFEDWHVSRVLPYWDLTSIAAIENATIPYHVLGSALFPEEYGVDLTERVRKVTRKKCQFLFSDVVMLALEAQAQTERLKRNANK